MTLARSAGVVALLALLLTVTVRVAGADAVDDEVRRIGKQLLCPVCQGTSVADSPSDLAVQMRGVIRRKLEEGEREPEIIRYFVERYGDAVLAEPPRRGLGLAVWLGPGLVLGVGAGVLFLLVHTWLRYRVAPASSRGTPLVAHRDGTSEGVGPVAYDARVRAELDRFRQES